MSFDIFGGACARTILISLSLWSVSTLSYTEFYIYNKLLFVVYANGRKSPPPHTDGPSKYVNQYGSELSG